MKLGTSKFGVQRGEFLSRHNGVYHPSRRVHGHMTRLHFRQRVIISRKQCEIDTTFARPPTALVVTSSRAAHRPLFYGCYHFAEAQELYIGLNRAHQAIRKHGLGALERRG